MNNINNNIKKNQPGLSTISYRTGTYPEFFDKMKKRLRHQFVNNDDGTKTFPLKSLTINEKDDFIVALLDSSSMVMDVLTFYQEQTANEAYLKTAGEKRSVKELADAVGYKLSPGSSASVYLSFTVDDTPETPNAVKIPTKTKIMSVSHDPKETPQIFETSAEFTAYKNLNALKLTPGESKVNFINQGSTSVSIEGVEASLKSGDNIIIAGDDFLNTWELFILNQVLPDNVNKYTKISWEIPWAYANQGTKLFSFDQKVTLFGHDAPLCDSLSKDEKLKYLVKEGETTFETKWNGPFIDAKNNISKDKKLKYLESSLINFKNEWDKLDKLSKDAKEDESEDANKKYKRKDNKSTSYEWMDLLGSSQAQFKLDFVAKLTWDGLPKQVKSQFKEDNATFHTTWPGFKIKKSDTKYEIDLSGEYEGISKGSLILLKDEGENPAKALVKIEKVFQTSRTDFRLTNNITRVNVSTDKDLSKFNLRTTSVLIKSKELKLKSATPETGANCKTLELQGNPAGLKSDIPLRITGKDKTGKKLAELVYINSIESKDNNTKVTLKNKLQNNYVRKNVEINANSVMAVHGETIKDEILGSGDSSMANQQFRLRRKPLAYLSTDKSSLKVLVNDILWTEVDSLYQEKSNSRSYMVRVNHSGDALIMFGDGKKGARLPGGYENIKVEYRIGSGKKGEVKEESLTIMVDSVPGIRSVINTRSATGGADPETIENIKKSVPLQRLIHDRIVSVADYENFVKTYPGVGKVLVSKIWTGEYQLIHITMARTEGRDLARESTLSADILKAIKKKQSSGQIVQLSPGTLTDLKIEADVFYNSLHKKEIVEKNIQQALLKKFSFEKRNFGQTVKKSEVISVIQQVPGVEYVIVKQSGNSEKKITAKAYWDVKTKKVIPAILFRLVNKDSIKLTMTER